MLIWHHAGDRPAKHQVRAAGIVRPDPAHPARGAAALVAGPGLVENDASLSRHDCFLGIHDDDLFSVQESLRADGRQTAPDVTGRLDRRHGHPMIRTPDPFGFWTASSSRVIARPPAA